MAVSTRIAIDSAASQWLSISNSIAGFDAGGDDTRHAPFQSEIKPVGAAGGPYRQGDGRSPFPKGPGSLPQSAARRPLSDMPVNPSLPSPAGDQGELVGRCMGLERDIEKEKGQNSIMSFALGLLAFYSYAGTAAALVMLAADALGYKKDLLGEHSTAKLIFASGGSYLAGNAALAGSMWYRDRVPDSAKAFESMNCKEVLERARRSAPAGERNKVDTFAMEGLPRAADIGRPLAADPRPGDFSALTMLLAECAALIYSIATGPAGFVQRFASAPAALMPMSARYDPREAI